MKPAHELGLFAQLALAPTREASGQGGARNVTLSVTLNSHKPSGEAWDASGGAAGAGTPSHASLW